MPDMREYFYVGYSSLANFAVPIRQRRKEAMTTTFYVFALATQMLTGPFGFNEACNKGGVIFQVTYQSYNASTVCRSMDNGGTDCITEGLVLKRISCKRVTRTEWVEQ